MKKWWAVITVVAAVVGIFTFIIQSEFLNRGAWNSWSLPLSGKIIYIDPGHGGADGGAENGDAVEKEIALTISKKLRDYLQQQGALVLMTRSTDEDLAEEGTKGLSRRKVQDLHKRAEIINESDADYFVSIHLNAIPSSRWRGAQTFYHEKYVENKVAAELIQEELIDNLENTDRQAKSISHVYLLKEAKKARCISRSWVSFQSNRARFINAG